MEVWPDGTLSEIGSAEITASRPEGRNWIVRSVGHDSSTSERKSVFMGKIYRQFSFRQSRIGILALRQRQ